MWYHMKPKLYHTDDQESYYRRMLLFMDPALDKVVHDYIMPPDPLPPPSPNSETYKSCWDFVKGSQQDLESSTRV